MSEEFGGVQEGGGNSVSYEKQVLLTPVETLVTLNESRTRGRPPYRKLQGTFRSGVWKGKRRTRGPTERLKHARRTSRN